MNHRGEFNTHCVQEKNTAKILSTVLQDETERLVWSLQWLLLECSTRSQEVKARREAEALSQATQLSGYSFKPYPHQVLVLF